MNRTAHHPPAHRKPAGSIGDIYADDMAEDWGHDAPTCLPFLKSSKRPALTIHPNSCDCHCHVFPTSQNHPLSQHRNYTPAPAPLSSYMTMATSLGIERAVFVQPSVYGTDHTAMLAAMAAFGDQSRGIAVLDAQVTDKELEHLHQAGVRGIRVNSVNSGGIDLDDQKSILVRISALGWHVQLYSNTAQLERQCDTLQRHDVEIVVDHFANIQISEGTSAKETSQFLTLLEDRQIWVKMSAPYRLYNHPAPYPDLVHFARDVVDIAPDRTIWGTDWPHTELTFWIPDDSDLLDLLLDWAPCPEARNKILISNPAALYGFPRSACEN